MRFKEFISEMEETGTTEVPASLPMDSINTQFNAVFDRPIAAPEFGILQVSKILANYGVEVPAFDFGLDPEGDEIVIDMPVNLHLYLIYSDNDSGLYDFYAEVVDDQGLQEILEDEDNEDEQ
jgi:hypothetical protein